MVKMKNHWIIAFTLFGFLALTGCESEEAISPAVPEERTETQTGKQDQMEQQNQAVAVLEPTQGNNATGQVTFKTQGEGVLVVADFEGLPAGKHGFHVHEKGDCSAPDASSAGGHYNPENTPHGAPDAPPSERHVGDLGNLEAGQDGTAHYERVDPLLSLSGPNSIIGKAVIVHAKADDFTSQPTGDAGPRLACGVIEMRE